MLECTAGDQCVGSLPHIYLDRIACNGVMGEQDAPYYAADNDACPSGQRTYSGFSSWAYLPETDEYSGYRYAQALMHAPVAVGIQGQAENSELQHYEGGVYNCQSVPGPADHAILLVGYMDAVEMADGATWDVFKAKNSWGSDWGESGFFNFRKDCPGRGSLATYTYAAMPIRDSEDAAPSSSPPPPPPPRAATIPGVHAERVLLVSLNKPILHSRMITDRFDAPRVQLVSMSSMGTPATRTSSGRSSAPDTCHLPTVQFFA